MSKVKIQGNASGTGVVTLTAPNTNTDRTITLPDGDITLGGGVDGIVSTANATAITIDANENVGVGTTSPVGKFAVSDGTTTGEINPSGGVCWVGTRSSHDVVMQVEASEKLRLKADGRGLSQFTAKAWVNYHGVNNSIRDSHNVSSITDNGTGQYVMNFANSFPNNDYAVSGSGTRAIAEDSYLCGITCPNNGFGTSSVRIKGHDYNSTQDLYQMHAIIFGD